MKMMSTTMLTETPMAILRFLAAPFEPPFDGSATMVGEEVVEAGQTVWY